LPAPPVHIGLCSDKANMQFMNNESVARDTLSGGGEMGERMRSFDWGKTSLGNVEDWPQSLKTCVRIILTSRQPMFVWWGKDLINLYNDAYLSIIGGKHPWALGRPASEVWREIWDQVEPRANTAMRKNEGTYDEALLLIMERNGYPEETYYTFSYSPVPGDDGDSQGIICANTDDTQRIISERQLRTMKDLGKKLGECRMEQEVFDGTIHVLQQNPHDFPFAILYRVEKEGKLVTLAGKTIDDLPVTIAPQELDPVAMPLLQEVIQTNKPRIVDHVIEQFGRLPSGPWQHAPDRILQIPVLQGGQKLPYAILCVGLNPYRQPDERYTSFFELVADQIATGLGNVQAIEEERKRAEALAEIDKAKTVFFSNISHEFRTPLTLMLGPLEELLSGTDGQLLPQHRQDIASTHRNAMRLLRLVNNLLDFSRMEAGRVQARFSPVDLSVFTADLAGTFRAVMENAGLQLEVNCGPLSEPVYIDREMWEKIVLNLLSNAFKYTLRGKIEVRLFERDRQVMLQVADTGIGIPHHEIPLMFERFHRVENNTGRTFEGTGIGLSLVKELVTLHHGTIAVDSKEGKGSVFTVAVPLGKSHLPATQVTDKDDRAYAPGLSELYVQEAVSLAGNVTGSFDEKSYAKTHSSISAEKDTNGNGKPFVLVVDDNADMRDYMQRLLEKKYFVETAPNGVAALHKIHVRRPDLVVSDIMMPVMDGIQLLNEVKGNPSIAAMPVILVSARAGEEAKITGFDTGADDYLTKPFSAKELIARVQAQLNIARVHRQAAAHLQNIFKQAPVGIAILQGPDFVFELVNDEYLQMVDRPLEAMVNKPIGEAVPELTTQGIPELLRQVLATGEPLHGSEFPLKINRHGRQEIVYFNFVYQPLRQTGNAIDSIMVVAIDVTELVKSKFNLKENEKQFRSMVLQSPIPMAIVSGPDWVIDVANDALLNNLWR
jgi:signal transduction histidine kinase/ActR/RegA family two-component response regulator